MDTQHCQDRCLPPCHISFSHPPYFIISIAAALALHAAAVFLFISIFNIKPSLARKPQIYSISIFSLKENLKPPLGKKTSKPNVLETKKPNQKDYKTYFKKKKEHTREKSIKKPIRGLTRKPPQKHKKIKETRKPSAPMKEKVLENSITAKKETTKKEQTAQKKENKGKGIKNLKGKNKIKTKRRIFISEDGYPSIYSWIASHKFYPIEALFKDEQGSVTVEFTIHTDGTITGIKISKGSFNSLNKATVKIIKDSSPIPKKILKHSNLKLPATVIVKLVFRIEG